MHSGGVSSRALALLSALLVAPWGAVQAAPPATVLLAVRPGLRPQLCDALQIQLASVAELRCERTAEQGDVATRIAALSKRVAELHATLGAFVVEEPGARTVQLVIVGARPDRAVLAYEPLRDLPAPDIDRSLALEVADALDAITRAQDSRAEQPQPSALPLAAALAPPPSAEPRARHALLLEVGGAHGGRGALPFAGLVALGLRRALGRRAFELVSSLGMGSRARSDDAAGELELRGLVAALGVRAVWRAGPLELGLHAGLGLLKVRASGTDRAGERGAGSVLSPELTLGSDLRLRLGDSAYLAFAPSLGFAPIAQRFRLAGSTARELDHVGFLLPLSLGVRTP